MAKEAPSGSFDFAPIILAGNRFSQALRSGWQGLRWLVRLAFVLLANVCSLILSSNSLCRDLLERLGENLILVGGADGHPNAVANAPRHQRAYDHSFYLHSLGECVGVLINLKVNEIGARR